MKKHIAYLLFGIACFSSEESGAARSSWDQALNAQRHSTRTSMKGGTESASRAERSSEIHYRSMTGGTEPRREAKRPSSSHWGTVRNHVRRGGGTEMSHTGSEHGSKSAESHRGMERAHSERGFGSRESGKEEMSRHEGRERFDDKSMRRRYKNHRKHHHGSHAACVREFQENATYKKEVAEMKRLMKEGKKLRHTLKGLMVHLKKKCPTQEYEVLVARAMIKSLEDRNKVLEETINHVRREHPVER